MRAIFSKIRLDLLRGDRQRLRESLRRELEKSQRPDTEQLDRLRRRLTELNHQIETGAERVLTAPEDLLDILTTKLQKMKREQQQLEQEMRGLQPAAKKEQAMAAQIDELADKAWQLVEELQQADPARVRELLRQAIERVELSFTTTQQGKRQKHHPTSGQVVFRGLSGFASRGDWQSFERVVEEVRGEVLVASPRNHFRLCAAMRSLVTARRLPRVAIAKLESHGESPRMVPIFSMNAPKSLI